MEVLVFDLYKGNKQQRKVPKDEDRGEILGKEREWNKFFVLDYVLEPGLQSCHVHGLISG